MKIYCAFSGEYSDTCLRGVYDNLEDAIKLLTGSDYDYCWHVEEFELNADMSSCRTVVEWENGEPCTYTDAECEELLRKHLLEHITLLQQEELYK